MSIEKIEFKESVSVVIPYFNRSSTIEKTLVSVLKQSLKPSEIIIVDDMSQLDDIEKLTSIIRKLELDSSFIRLHVSKSKLYGAKARNLGMEMARGEIIALIDSDDEWLEDHLLISVRSLCENNSDLCYSSHVIDDGCSRIKTSSYQYIDADELPIDFVMSNAMPQTSSFVFKKSAFDLGLLKFDENLRRHQDLQFLNQALTNVKCVYTNEHTTIVNWIKGEKRTVDFDSCKNFVEKFETVINKRVYFKYLLKMYMIAYEHGDKVNRKYYSKKARLFKDRFYHHSLLIHPYFTNIIFKSYKIVSRLF